MSAPTIGTPVGRWAGFGPYYAMFPVDFAFQVVRDFCPLGGSVFDPFAGRGSSIYAAAAQERTGLGIEINWVGWVYSQAKLHPACETAVLRRLHQIGALASAPTNRVWLQNEVCELPEFFEVCYAPRVLNFLLMARNQLKWRSNPTDWTLMAHILVYLHAKAGSGLSNQMRQSKAMSPGYSVRWWRERELQPPDLDAVAWLQTRIQWRYAKGEAPLNHARVWRGDSTKQAKKIQNQIAKGELQKFDLLFTSPPYQGVTNYQYDQWLRLWMLGQPPVPVSGTIRKSGRFECEADYANLISTVFKVNAPLLAADATIYVRTDARPFTRATTQAILREVFPHKHFRVEEAPYKKHTQTSLFGDKEVKPGEVDMILTP